jgi:dTDP-4-dehydrorhamnose reductase
MPCRCIRSSSKKTARLRKSISKRLLITGLGGTLAPVLAEAARRAGWEIAGWNRQQIPPEKEAIAQAWLRDTAPDAIAHLATGSVEWARQLAAYTAVSQVPFVFTSTAMVFHHEPDGPHAIEDKRTAEDDYGKQKIACEDAVLTANVHSAVVRIGWQIRADARGNNMLAHLDQWQQREGRIAASGAWKPACSFMDDTADALIGIVNAGERGVIHLDSNASEGHTFDHIVHAMRRTFQRDHWVVEANESYRHDQRLQGGAARMPSLSSRLQTL